MDEISLQKDILEADTIKAVSNEQNENGRLFGSVHSPNNDSASTKEESQSNQDSIFETNPFERQPNPIKEFDERKFGY